MSSMWRFGFPLILALATAASNGAGNAAPGDLQAYPLPSIQIPRNDVGYAIGEWRRLRQSSGYPFAAYARFLAANSGWPGEAALRRTAERAMRPGESPALVLAFFRSEAPQSANGHARHAEALAATGRPAEALAAAREALAAGGLAPYDEALILARFGGRLTSADYDRRVDRLLLDRMTADAYRLLPWASAARRAAFEARIAMHSRALDAEQRYAAVAALAASDAGLLFDRVRYLDETGNERSARMLLARPHSFTARPIDPAKWYELMQTTARAAAAEGQWLTAFQIARQVDDAFPAGSDISLKSLPVRDAYTNLTWLAGSAALSPLGRPGEAVGLFQRYSRGGRSLQVATKGLYWAGRAAAAARQPTEATSLFTTAASYPDQFYGQLALERLGRRVPMPSALPTLLVSDAQRLAFSQRRLVQAVRQLGQYGYRSEQSQFIRALAEAATSDADRVLASELAVQIGRQDLAVWIARAARSRGDQFYVRSAYPLLANAFTSARLWPLVHGITRQESSFDRAAVSSAGARGMMQLMLPTAREQAGKMGHSYDSARLTSDPGYNVMLGSAYFERLLSRWGGNYPLAVASYNAGAGNVAKWIRANGDPRQPGVDVVQWIERIPFTETRGYVQRVLENSVVYEQLNPYQRPVGTFQLSQYLGKSRPG